MRVPVHPHAYCFYLPLSLPHTYALSHARVHAHALRWAAHRRKERHAHDYAYAYSLRWAAYQRRKTQP